VTIPRARLPGNHGVSASESGYVFRRRATQPRLKRSASRDRAGCQRAARCFRTRSAPVIALSPIGLAKLGTADHAEQDHGGPRETLS
jgi:hypothetical protein